MGGRPVDNPTFKNGPASRGGYSKFSTDHYCCHAGGQWQLTLMSVCLVKVPVEIKRKAEER